MNLRLNKNDILKSVDNRFLIKIDDLFAARVFGRVLVKIGYSGVKIFDKIFNRCDYYFFRCEEGEGLVCAGSGGDAVGEPLTREQILILKKICREKNKKSLGIRLKHFLRDVIKERTAVCQTAANDCARPALSCSNN